MNKEVKEKWLHALRSGEYKQGRGQLRRTFGNGEKVYCCLGVLCDLHQKEYPSQSAWDKDDCFCANAFLERKIDFLPRTVMDWADLSGERGAIPGTQTMLYRLNDDGYSFETIANVIEKHL